MTSSLNKKNYNLQTYNRGLVPVNSVSLAFFFSRFGGKLPRKVNSILDIKSCKVSLIRKIIGNDIFSGSMYFAFLKRSKDFVLFSNLDFLEVFKNIKAFSLTTGNIRLQNVLVFNYVVDYPFFERLFTPFFMLPVTLFNLKNFGLVAPFIFLAARLLSFLKFIFFQNLGIFSTLKLKKELAVSAAVQEHFV